ncbi:MAG: transporter substrate-binding domain-containing protein [Alphaproteobacteria bacterium]
MKNIIIALLVSIIAAYITVRVTTTSDVLAPAVTQETAFERVMRTKTLRCGYAPVGLALQKDPNTGALSGTVYDVMEALGSALDIKIDWAEEITFGTAMTGLQSGRYDAVCSNLYARPNWMPHAELSESYQYVPVNAYVKVGDHRFVTREAVNRPEVKIAYQDGTVPAFIKKTDFPNAGALAVVDMDYSDILLGVATGKADITFVEPAVAEDFMKNNPDKIELAAAISPLYVFPIVLAVNKGEHSLNSMLSGAIKYLQNKDSIEMILRKHEKYPGMFWRAAPTYLHPQPLSK